MSKTFWCPDAPQESYRPFPEDEPDYVSRRSVLPEVNFSNVNADAMLTLIGEVPDVCGSIPLERLPDVRRKLIELINSPSARKDGVRPTASWKIPGGPTVISCGIDENYIQRRARELLELVVLAQERDYPITYG